jgi:hypothetical protein
MAPAIKAVEVAVIGRNCIIPGSCASRETLRLSGHSEHFIGRSRPQVSWASSPLGCSTPWAAPFSYSKGLDESL